MFPRLWWLCLHLRQKNSKVFPFHLPHLLQALIFVSLNFAELCCVLPAFCCKMEQCIFLLGQNAIVTRSSGEAMNDSCPVQQTSVFNVWGIWMLHIRGQTCFIWIHVSQTGVPAIEFVSVQVFLTALGPLYTVYLGAALSGSMQVLLIGPVTVALRFSRRWYVHYKELWRVRFAGVLWLNDLVHR